VNAHTSQLNALAQEEAANTTRVAGERGRNVAGARRDETEARLLRESRQARIREERDERKALEQSERLAWPDRYCPPRHSTHVEPSFLEMYGIL